VHPRFGGKLPTADRPLGAAMERNGQWRALCWNFHASSFDASAGRATPREIALKDGL
jgi:hypothetical protein